MFLTNRTRSAPHVDGWNNWTRAVPLLLVILVAPADSIAGNTEEGWVIGIRLRLGWKYDDVRMCGATGPGVPHGPDIDIAAFGAVPVAGDHSLDLNLPVFRPILFALGARLLQFEPEATLLVHSSDYAGRRVVAGPSLGLSVNYGPDLNSTIDPRGRGRSFWSIGPRIGGYAGIQLVRPGHRSAYQLGLHAYVTPLFSIEDPEDHGGWILGMTLDNDLRFGTGSSATDRP